MDLPIPWVELKRLVTSQLERLYWTDLHRSCKGNVSEMARRSRCERNHVRVYLRRHKIGGRR